MRKVVMKMEEPLEEVFLFLVRLVFRVEFLLRNITSEKK